MNYNRKFNPNIWETQRPVHSIPPFVNPQPNFYQNNQNQNFPPPNNNFNNFHQNQLRPLLPDPPNVGHPQQFRRFNNNNRRPGPACARQNNNNFHNNNSHNKWMKDNNRDDPFSNRDIRGDINSNNNNRLRPEENSQADHFPCDTSDPPKYKSLVEHLKQFQNSRKNSDSKDIDAICAKNASEASKKLLTQLKTMDKDGVKDLINNPKQPYKKKVLNIQAREKLREQMRKKLKKLGTEGDTSSSQIDHDESIDYEKIPESLIAQIGKTIALSGDDMELSDMDLSESINEEVVEEKDVDLDIVKQNLGNDFLMGSEMLLMNGFSLLAETEQETDADDSMTKLPPLPVDFPEKPPSPPPEPVKPPEEKAAFSSIEKPWEAIPVRQNNDHEWDIESAKNPDPPAIVNEPPPIKTAPIEDDEWDSAEKSVPSANVNETPTQVVNEEQIPAPAESGQRANETYGEYRRRLAAEREVPNTNDEWNEEESNRQKPPPQSNFNKNRRSNDWKEGGGRQDNWNRNKKQQQFNNRKSRFEIERGRDGKQNSAPRNLSRDTNRSFDSCRTEEIKDGHNYRFQSEKKSQEPDIERLNTILNPKPLQFKGSFNKRSFNQRSRSRNRTPVNHSMERDFEDILTIPANDARPCFHTLKKVMEIDAEIARIHDKIHGIDKVISNLQSERLGYQKNFSRLQHDRKVLFDNLMKRALSNDDKEKEKEKEKESPVASNKSQIEKKLQNIVDQKKRKNDEPPEEQKKKKQAVEVVETTSAAEKAAQLQREKEEEERKQKNAEKKRLKQLRREREEAEKRRLEEKIRQQAAAATVTTTIKQEPKDDKPKKSQKPSGTLFKHSDIIQVSNYKILEPRVNLQRVTIVQSLVDKFKASGFIEIDTEEWESWCKPIKPEEKVKKEDEKVVDTERDPLALDEGSPPTPGSNLVSNEESMLVEIPEQDYSEWCGNFSAHSQPIVSLQNIHGKYLVAACEDGQVIKYHLSDGKPACIFSKHTEICNSFLYDDRGAIYTVSTDGFLHKIRYKSFQLIASENFNEPLQVIEKSKAGIYVGTKSGKIFRLKPDLTERENEPICDLGALILCMRATKEGSRNILLISSRTNAIQVRDASDGLLLRTLSDDLAGVSIYDMLINGSTIYCGSNRHEIFEVDFTTGALVKKRPCGAGAICIKLHKNQLIAACYDGNIYIFNTDNDDDAINICGPSNMLLSMDLWENKIIASTKDKTLKIMTIPQN